MGLPEMRRDKSILVLHLNRSFEEPVHELQKLLVIIKKSASVNIVEVQVEETFVFAAL